ncbi:MAG: hypothetical protein GY906_13230 [bacterium]|nr:hypothetical protein [bacterium]
MISSHLYRIFCHGVVVCIGVVVSCGCRTVAVDATNNEAVARPAKDRSEYVAVIRAELPDRPYKAIGNVRAKVKLSPYRKSVWPDERVLEKMKPKARELGADALVNLRVEQTKGGGTYVSPDGGVALGNSQVWIATAIVWIEEREPMASQESAVK